MTRAICTSLLLLPILVVFTAKLCADDPHVEAFEHWPTDLRIKGTVIACSDEVPSKVLEWILETGDETEEADSENGALNHLTVVVFPDIDDNEYDSLRQQLDELESVDIFRLPADNNQLADNVTRSVASAERIWLVSKGSLSDRHIQIMRELESSLHRAVGERAFVMCCGPAARLLGTVAITGGTHHAETTTKGINLIPDSVVETDFGDPTDKRRLWSVLASHPRLIGVGVETKTAAVLSGRKFHVRGAGGAEFHLMANEHFPLKTKRLVEPPSERPNPYQSLVDLTAWRRDAIDRTMQLFPPVEPDPPHVAHGTLFIVGGGGIPDGMMERFVELAGGENAKIVYVPCTEREQVRGGGRASRMFEAYGVASVTLLHTKNRIQADSDETFLAPLAEATGIWFGGGRQWNFSDSYYGTRAHRMMKQVLERGGVIGGSSAGASIQARYLARANPLGNIDIMAPGYERGGLGFISGVAIDQHFTQRGRQKDMTQLVNRYPQLLGIGIDESTALVVQKSIGEVMGDGKVFFYDRNLPVVPDQADYIALGDGEKFDLRERKVIE